MKFKSHIPAVSSLLLVILSVIFLLLKFNEASGSEFKILFILLLLISGSVILVGAYSYKKCFRVNRFFLGHGIAFALIMLLSLAQVVGLVIDREFGYSFGLRVVWLQCLAAFLISMPPILEHFKSLRVQDSSVGIWHPGICMLYLFCTLYPVQHYVINNPEAFSLGLMFQFALIALIFPALSYLGLYFYVRPFLTVLQYYLANLSLALIIFLMYMRPVLRDFSTLLTGVVGFNVSASVLAVVVFVILAFSAFKLRSHVGRFLVVFLILVFTNSSYVLYTFDDPQVQLESKSISGAITISNKPNIYILVVDGYQSKEGLQVKGLQNFDIGNKLAGKGFVVYSNAFSNYKPSVPSLINFFEIEHHYYHTPSDWSSVLTGDNKLYSMLKSNGYRTIIAHRTDFFLRGKCESDFCSPAPGKFGQVSFILAETIFYKKDFFKRTKLGRWDYKNNFYKLLGKSMTPFVVYSHVLLPSHGPKGCDDQQKEIDLYGKELLRANNWLSETIGQIESRDQQALIILLGDHGAFLSDNCTWGNPDVTSRHTIIDNLGVLMAVRWPDNYDNRYDANIHTLLDLSWYLLQYLSNDGLDEKAKPASSAFLKSGDKIYKVIQDGIVIDDPQEYESGAGPLSAQPLTRSD